MDFAQLPWRWNHPENAIALPSARHLCEFCFAVWSSEKHPSGFPVGVFICKGLWTSSVWVLYSLFFRDSVRSALILNFTRAIFEDFLINMEKPHPILQIHSSLAVLKSDVTSSNPLSCSPLCLVFLEHWLTLAVLESSAWMLIGVLQGIRTCVSSATHPISSHHLLFSFFTHSASANTLADSTASCLFVEHGSTAHFSPTSVLHLFNSSSHFILQPSACLQRWVESEMCGSFSL